MSSIAVIPPAIPPAMPLTRDLEDGVAPGADVVVACGGWVKIAEDVGWAGDVKDTSKHETFVPFFTEKGNEFAVGPPATVATN